ncbi:hypothetical protein HK102_010184 [Quaeritorhiza haematococci]|nr:hypothetical protein HK102_010184 [Quaeritorhiza haematococci]
MCWSQRIPPFEPQSAFLPPYVPKPGSLKSWQQPSSIFLAIFTRIILFIFPVSIDWNVKGEKKGVKPLKFWKGEERVELPNNGKVLFVVNHNLHGLDVPALMSAIYMKTGVFPRGLADTAHFFVPIWAHLIYFFGGFPGTRDNCSDCMKAGQPLLVFPGGHYEVYRKMSDPKYHVMWRERMGFAKLAAAHGYTIIPVTSVGMGDMLRTFFEIPIPDVFFSLMGDKRRGQIIPASLPVAYQRQYFKFSENIPTDPSKAGDIEYIKEIRELSRQAVDSGVDELVAWQERDSQRYILKPLF